MSTRLRAFLLVAFSLSFCPFLMAEGDNKPLIVKPPKRTLIGNSTILASGGKWTLVPKGAIIQLPDSYKNKVVTKPKGTLVKWSQFLASNGSWIHKFPVQMQQAQGKTLISQEVIQRFAKMNKVVIATCADGPISVNPKALLPPAEPKTKKAP